MSTLTLNKSAANKSAARPSAMTRNVLRALGMFFAQFALFGLATAGGGGGGLPWEGPLTAVANSLTGPIALTISIIAMAAAGGTLVFGGELGEFTRKAVMLVLAISFLVFGAGFMTAVFGISGALVI